MSCHLSRVHCTMESCEASRKLQYKQSAELRCECDVLQPESFGIAQSAFHTRVGAFAAKFATGSTVVCLYI